MNCRKVRLRLFSYFKNELSEDEKKKIKFHLESCPDCAQESLEVERVSSLVKTSIETLTPSPDFNQKLLFEIQKFSPAKGGAKEAKSPSNFSLLCSHFPLRARWVLAGSFMVIILASVFWFTHKPAPIKPEALSTGDKKTETFKLVNQEDRREDSLNQEMLRELVKRSRSGTKTFVLDNFRSVGPRNIDERSIPENMSKRFILETTGYPPQNRRTGNYYVLPVVSTQQVSEKVNY
jgi:hypothetical protein